MDIALLILAYFIGTIPTGLLLTKMAGLGDIRAIGSGNIGATNVLRTGNRKIAALTLLIDLLKGWLAVWLVKQLGTAEWAAPLAGLLVVLGHLFPVWLKFKGGKGVATGVGVFIGLSPLLGFSVMAVWNLVFFTTRLSSLAAIVAYISGTLLAFILSPTPVFACAFAISLLVILRHRENIQRLIRGEESRFTKL